MVFNESEVFGVKRADVFGRQIFLEGTFLADGEDELHKRLVNVVRSALFGLCPKQRLQVVVLELVKNRRLTMLDNVLGNDKIDVAKLGVFVTVEEVLLHRAFQRLFFEFLVVHGGSFGGKVTVFYLWVRH